MPRGGSRPGAGRRKSSLTTRTRNIAEKAMNEGITPLEVMLTAMRKHAAAEHWDQASAIAEKAAPYMHPKLASVEHKNGEDGPFKIIISSGDGDL